MKKNEEGKEVPEREAIPMDRLVSNGLVPPAFNASALPYLAWQQIDRAVIQATRDRLAAWNDLVAANTYSGFNGMAVTGLVKDSMTDPGDAKVDMLHRSGYMGDDSLSD